MPFDWRFRNFKRDPQPFLNGAVIDAEIARNNLVQNAGNDMEGYTPLESTLAAQAMEGYKPVVPATQSQLAAGASQAMQGYTPNSAGRPSVPNDMHGGMGQPDLEGYGESLQAASDAAAAEQQAQQEAAQKQSQIDSIKARINELKSQIAANQAKLKNWQGVGGQVAALEARKINAQDPTSVWRWKEGMDAQKAQRAADLERIEKEKKLTEAKNLKLNRNKIDNILQTTMPTQNMTRDKMDMAVKQLNDAEELAKNYGDTDALKKINERKNELGVYVPVDDEANIIESDFVKNMEMVGKKGGMSKKQFAQYVQSVLDDPKNKHIWHYSPELQRKLYTAIGKNTGAKPTNYAGY